MIGVNRMIFLLGLVLFGLLILSCAEEKKPKTVFVPDHSMRDMMLESKKVYDNLGQDAKLNIALAQASEEDPEIINKVKSMKSPWLVMQYLKNNKAFQTAAAKQGINLDSVPDHMYTRMTEPTLEEITKGKGINN